MTISVCVDQERIAKGRRGSLHACPVALAIRADSRVSHCTVAPEAAWIMVQGSGGHFTQLPGMIGDWIRAFDSKQPVEPVSFTLELL